MNITTMYSIRIKDHCHIFKDTVGVFRAAVDYIIHVCVFNWDLIKECPSQNLKMTSVEHLIHATGNRPSVPYDFDRQFYKFPSYLRRAAINSAIGKVSSYFSNLANWETADPASRGKRPGYPRAGYVYPCLYRGDTYKEDGAYSARIKVYTRNTWDWITVSLRKSDVDYINRHCAHRKQCAPVLQKRGRLWSLDFAFVENATLSESDIYNRLVLAVDLGINNACTCCVMTSEGTVVGREFLKLPAENDSLRHVLGRLKKAQRRGAFHMPRLWATVNGINDDIAVKTAEFIVNTAVKYNVDVIVMEHLNVNGRKRGSKKQRLHFWKVKYVQAMVTDKAHRNGIRISTVCVWNTSRLAFDGTGRVLRGRESDKTGGSYSVCEFQSGKIYNCDLNASYNIGARYFIRELLKSLPETVRLHLEANDPSACKRSTCTLSTLINLNAALAA